MRTMLYHRTLPPRIATDAAEVAQLLADGWADTPVAFYAPVAEPVAGDDSIDPTPTPPVEPTARRPRKR